MFAPSGKTVVHKVLVLANEGASPVANDLDASSELSKIAKLNATSGGTTVRSLERFCISALSAPPAGALGFGPALLHLLVQRH